MGDSEVWAKRSESWLKAINEVARGAPERTDFHLHTRNF
jgi:hypothetical protein